MFGIFGRLGHIFFYSRIDEDVITCRPLYWNFKTYSALLPENAINDFTNSFKSRRTRSATNFFGRSNALQANAPMIKKNVNVRKRTSPNRTSPNRKKQQTLTQQYYAPFETSESSSPGGSTFCDEDSPSNVPNGPYTL